MKIAKSKKKKYLEKKVTERVVILGAGEVGLHIMQKLASDQYDVVLIDHSEDKVKEAKGLADVATYTGNGCDARIYIDTELNEKDLFIAVTSSDEVNLVASSMAQAFGCTNNIVRVRKSFYREFKNSPINMDFWRESGVGVLFNQNHITVNKILRLIEKPGAIEAIQVSNTEVQLIAYRVKKESLLCGRRLIGLKDVPKFDELLVIGVAKLSDKDRANDDYIAPIHVKAPTDKEFDFNSSDKTGKKQVKNAKEQMFIPTGDYRIQEDDILYVSGKASTLKHLGTLFDPDLSQNIHNIFILSASMLACQLAEELIKKYPRKSIFLLVSSKREGYFAKDTVNPKINVLLVDIHNIQELINEGLDERCIFIGASENEDDNVLGCLLIKEETGAKTISVIQSAIYSHLIPFLDIDVTVSPKMLLVSDVLKVLRKGVHDVLSIKGGDAEILDFIINEKSNMINKKIQDIGFPEDIIIMSIIRGDEMIIPHGSIRLYKNDHVIFFVLKKAVKKIQEFLSQS